MEKEKFESAYFHLQYSLEVGKNCEIKPIFDHCNSSGAG